MKKIETVAMIGVGAMGSFFAPRLYALLGKENFRVIAHGERKTRMENEGLTINGTNYHFPVVTPGADLKPADLIIIGVKSTALSTALDEISKQVGPDTLILSLLNGVDSEEKIAARYGDAHVVYAFMRVSIVMQNHCCRYDPQVGRIYFGEKKNPALSERVLMIKELFESADIPYRIPADMIHDQWFKFMANVGENLISALLGIPFGGFHVSEHTNILRVKAMEEVIAIANCKGICLGEEELLKQEKAIANIPFKNKPSTLQDLEAGRKTEIDMFAGEVMRMGKECGISTPINEFLYHAFRVLEEKNEGLYNRGE